MISKYNRLKAALTILDMDLKAFCKEIHVTRSTVRRYFKGKMERKNYYLDEKLDELWDQAMIEVSKFERRRELNKY